MCEYWGLKVKFDITANMAKKANRRSRVKKANATERAKIGIGFTSSAINFEKVSLDNINIKTWRTSVIFKANLRFLRYDQKKLSPS